MCLAPAVEAGTVCRTFLDKPAAYQVVSEEIRGSRFFQGVSVINNASDDKLIGTEDLGSSVLPHTNISWLRIRRLVHLLHL